MVKVFIGNHKTLTKYVQMLEDGVPLPVNDGIHRADMGPFSRFSDVEKHRIPALQKASG